MVPYWHVRSPNYPSDIVGDKKTALYLNTTNNFERHIPELSKTDSVHTWNNHGRHILSN